jgi:hypothetical protein
MSGWAALHDVLGYTDEALEVLGSTSTAMAGTATIKSPARRCQTQRKAPQIWLQRLR